MMELLNYSNYELVDKTEKSPQNYQELDLRSRFRLISTSPSLDNRIKQNSCIQIQHVKSEMYLSYQTSVSSPLLVAKADLSPTLDMNMMNSNHATLREE